MEENVSLMYHTEPEEEDSTFLQIQRTKTKHVV